MGSNDLECQNSSWGTGTHIYTALLNKGNEVRILVKAFNPERVFAGTGFSYAENRVFWLENNLPWFIKNTVIWLLDISLEIVLYLTIFIEFIIFF